MQGISIGVQSLRKDFRRRWMMGIKEYRKKYRKEHKEEISKYNKEYGKKHYQENKEAMLEHMKEYYSQNRETILKRVKNYYQENKEGKKGYIKNYKINNPDKIRLWNKKYRENNREKLIEYCKNSYKKYYKKIGLAIGRSLKDNKAGRQWESIVGYTLSDLIKHLKSTIPEGYTWNDYLNGKLHIDHILPIRLFQFNSTEDEEFKQCWNLYNLRLLSEKDNKSKQDNINDPILLGLLLKEMS